MLFAVIGDIHGNLPALDAALDVFHEAGILTVINTGDSATGYPWGSEVIRRLREEQIPSVQGELDRLTVRFRRKRHALATRLDPDTCHALDYAYTHIPSEDLEFLRGLPRERIVEAEGLRIFVSHGTPGDPSRGLTPQDDASRFLRAREYANADIVLGGKTHQPFVLLTAETLFVNPGSLGVPGERLGTYALVNTETSPWSAEIREIAYDRRSAAQALRDAHLPDPARSPAAD